MTNIKRVNPNTLVATDHQGYLSYMESKRTFEAQEKKINSLESDIAEMKQLLLKVLNEHSTNNS